MNKQIYLAHSVHQRTMGRKIEKRIEAKKQGWEVYNPFYPKDPDLFRGDIKALDEGHIQPWDIRDEERSKWIVKTDLQAVAASDLLICIYPNRRTVGIPCEMTFAWMMHIPIISVVPEDMLGHPWIVGMSDIVLTDIEEVYDSIK